MRPLNNLRAMAALRLRFEFADAVILLGHEIQQFAHRRQQAATRGEDRVHVARLGLPGPPTFTRRPASSSSWIMTIGKATTPTPRSAACFKASMSSVTNRGE